MGLLSPIDGSETKRLSSVIADKKEPRRSRLLAIRPWLLRRYKTYAKRSTTLSRIRKANVSDQVRSDCEHCFDHETVALAEIKAAIIGNLPPSNRFLCPYCSAVKWDTFDHFAPKGLFPEYSVLAANLIPACYRCNVKKGNAWIKNGSLTMLNLYFDEWPADQFLEVDLSYDDSLGATIRFRINEGALGAGAARMRSHFQRLDLLALYAEAGSSTVAEYRTTLRKHSFTSLAGVRASLLEEAEGLRELYGNNHWKALTAEALAYTQTFLRAMAVR